MRFVVREQPYEKPIGAGLFRYEQDGQPTGAVEHWRLTTAVSSYQILRVDLDAREARSGHSYLFHLVRQEDGTPERLGYRFWRTGFSVEGTLLFEEGELLNRRVVNGRSSEESLQINSNAFWFPSTIGLGLAAQITQTATATLNNQADSETILQLEPCQLENTAGNTGTETLNRQTYDTRIQTLTWQNNKRTVTLDTAKAWPLKMERDDGLTAVETRYIWYR